MKIYDLMYNAKPPQGIENRKAYIVGGGIAGLATAAFLADDIHMPAQNITIYEALKDVGGSMDGTGDAAHGYLCRGERELEPFMESLWYLCSKAPSLRHPGRTVLDDVWDFNYEKPIHSEYRVIENQGKLVDIHNYKLDDEIMEKILDLLYMPETKLEGMSIEEYFPERFFDSNLWWTFHSMLAFKRYHSVIEAKRYFRRFTHFAPESDYLHGILHTDLNEYDAIIKPIKVWLQGLGVNFSTGTSVTEIMLTSDNNTVTGLEIARQGETSSIPVAPEDFVFFTNGSMTQNTCWGDNHTVAATNRDTVKRGVFTVWERLAARDKKFGNPAAFTSDIDKTKWVSFFPTITDFPQFVKRLEEVSGSEAGCGGAITIRDSAWDITIILHHKPFFPNQPDNVEVFWAYGLYGENIGNYIKKPMCECTGNEMMIELLYHLGMMDMKDELLAHSYISTAMMPYITSQFMPRNIADRPKVVPAGCTNLAFIGQFVETPEDAVFTVETSCRTAMHAVYALTGVERKQLEVAPTFYDMRYVLALFKKFQNIDTFTRTDLPKINPLKIGEIEKKVLKFLNQVEPMPTIYPGRENPPYKK
jgi:oleate hydratase